MTGATVDATKGASYVDMAFLLLRLYFYHGHIILYILHVICSILIRLICLNQMIHKVLLNIL